ncbi:radial spoke protein 9 [Scenedesmus sp. NREL 46B-D3]|nr:radial spoke protein 9 [Scenedesmus sp. NREL 46B-D3]
MVQLEPNLQLMLQHLTPCGAVLPAEATAAMDHSIPIKRSEAGLKSMVLWGRFLARNGKDYLVAEGYNNATANGKVVGRPAYCGPDTAAHAAKLRMQLSGDPAFQYTVNDTAGGPSSAAEPAADSEDSGKYVVTEVQRLRTMIDNVNSATAVQPKGYFIANAHNEVVPNRLFSGLDYPDKLESYVHRSSLLEEGKGGGLAGDVRGSWSLQYDSFKGVALLRSLLFPGYCFYYSSHGLTWASLYVGDGLQNNDLVFML